MVSASIGVRASFLTGGLYGDIVSHSDFQVNLKPPGASIFLSKLIKACHLYIDFSYSLAEETTRDVETSLDALLRASLPFHCCLRFVAARISFQFEESKFKTTTAESAAAKQSMLNIEKAKIRPAINFAAIQLT